MKSAALYFCILGLLISSQTLAQTTESKGFETNIQKLDNSNQKTDRSTSFVLSGRILDSETGEPLSYATVSINQLGLGTASNLDGDWSLRIPASASNMKLTINFMGYTPQDKSIANLQDKSVFKLAPKSFQINEVVILSGDFIAELLSKAYKAIPENYPTDPSLCEGFYRETQRVNDSLFLYFNEAVLNVYKNTYKNTKNFGQIQVEKSRKNVFPGIDSISDVRFYGGPHFPNDLDIVFSRWDFIKPSEYKNWKYELEGVYKDSVTDVYTIGFKNRNAPNSNFQGEIYINKDDMAYVGFELRRAGLAAISMANLPTDIAYIPGNTTAKIGYTRQGDVYNLSYISYKSSGINTASKTRIYKDIEYVTTSIKKDSISPIPFGQQFDYTDILSIKADNYDQSYWKDYNILQESKVLTSQTNMLYQKDQAMQQLTKVYNRELTKDEKILLFLKRFTFDGGAAYSPMTYRGGQHRIFYGIADGEIPASGDPATTIPHAEKTVSSQFFALSFKDGIRFELTKKLSIFSALSTAIYGMAQIQYDLGLTYRLPLAQSGRWIFLDLGLAASTVSSKMDICSMSNPNGSIQIGGKTLKSKSIDVKAGKSGMGFKPVANLSVRMGKKYELFTEGTYFLPLLLKRDYVQFKEASGFFLSRKSSKIKWNDPDMNFIVDNVRINKPLLEVDPFQFRIGIRSGF
jgi:CarboxypepD_reg-like domain